MKINRLYAEDLFSYETLDLRLADIGLILIEGENRDLGGSNGSGKSNLFKALTWIIHGRCSQNGDILSADDVIREDEDHEPIVGRSRGFVEIDRGDLVMKIFRHRKHSEYGNKVLLYVGDQEVTASSDRETQALIDQYLGIDFDSWIYAVMFPQDAAGFATLTDSKQKAILDKILGTERFDRARQKAKDLLKPLTETHQKAQGQLAELERSSESQKASLVDLERKQTYWEANRKQAEDQKRQQLSVLNAACPQLANYEVLEARKSALEEQQINKADRKGVQDVLNQWRRHQVDVQSNLRMLQSARQPVWDRPVPVGVIEDVQRVLNDLHRVIIDQHKRLGACTAKLQEAERQTKLRNFTNDCSQCGQPLTPAAKDKMFGKFAGDVRILRTEEQQIKDDLVGMESQTKDLEAMLSALSDYEDFWKATEVYKHSSSQVAYYQDQNQNCEVNLKACEAALLLLDEYSEICNKLRIHTLECERWCGQVDALNLQIKELVMQSSPYLELQEKARASLAAIQSEIEKKQQILEKLDQRIAILEFWDQGFGPKGVRSLLLDHVTPELNRVANDYLDVLSSGMAKMKFVTTKQLKSGETRDDFHVEVEFQHGGGAYNRISGGERQRPDLASMFALGDLAAARSRFPISLRLLDEPFDGLDGLGAEQVVQVLQTKIVPKVGTVLVMTHDDNLKQLIEDRILVVKENGVSRLLA